MHNPFRYFNSSPQVVRLAVMMYIRYPLSLRRSCQSNANQSPNGETARLSGGQLTPLGQRDRAVLLEDVAAVEVSVEVEMVVDRGMNGGEFLRGFDAPELRRRSFSSSERLV